MKLIGFSFLLVVILFNTSCSKEEGCTDPDANNYNPEAEKDDGSCDYSKPPETGTFKLSFSSFVSGGQPLVINQSYIDSLGYNLQIEGFKFYISNVTLVKTNNQEVIIKDVDLIDFKITDENFTSAIVPVGDYKEIKFGIGVDSLLNEADPTVYDLGHPLSIFQGTYWTWSTQYRFLMVEGRADTVIGSSGNFDQLLIYHTGTKGLYREYSKNVSFSVQANTTHEEGLKINLNKLFYGTSNTIDLVSESATHTTTNYPLATEITENFKAAIE